jgi:hypothetical protein
MSQRHTKPEPGQIRSALAKVLAAPSFATSARLSRLLRFIVEQTLSGRAHELKEYTGVDLILDTDLRQREQPSVVGEALIR